MTTEGVVTYDARLDVENDELLLRPGMTATVSVVTREAKGVLTIPNAAFRYSPPLRTAKEGWSLQRLFMPRMGRPRDNRQQRTREPDGTRAVYVLKDGQPRKVQVKTGSTDGEKTEILSGLSEGEQLITGTRDAQLMAKGAQTLIRFDGVRKTYGKGEAKVHALAGVSFAIDRGEFVAIMGPSGSGKSTAMNIVGCLDTPTSGIYSFLGADAGRLDRGRRATLRNRYIGFVFQGYNLLARTTAAENVELPLIYRGVAGRRAAEAGDAGSGGGRARGARASYAGRAFRGPAAARCDRPRHRHPPYPAGCRRADGQSGYGAQPRDHEPADPAERAISA